MGLDRVTVRINDERSVIARPVISAQSGLAVIAAAGSERRSVEGIDTLRIRSNETEVQARLHVRPDRMVYRADPERYGVAPVAKRSLASLRH